MLQIHLVYFLSALSENWQFFQADLVPFIGMVLENMIWALGLLISTGVSLLQVLLNNRARIYMCVY